MEALRTTDDVLILERARLSEGRSDEHVYNAVAKNLGSRYCGTGTLIDVGCGSGNLRTITQKLFDRYVGVDVVRYEGFPIDGEFVSCNLEGYSVALSSEIADAVAAVETIEHLDNPRAFMREIARLVKPGGWIVVTTPNQLSLLSKMTLMLKNQFNAFQAVSYPAHRTALLEIDLIRMATECGLCDIAVEYTNRGRMPLSGKHWPRYCGGRPFSDNVLIAARKPGRLILATV